MGKGVLIAALVGSVWVVAMIWNSAQGSCHPKCQEVELKAAQEALSTVGFDPGRMDGTWHEKTQNAVHRFQQSEKLPGTGNLDDATMGRLLEKAKSMKGH